MKAVLYGATGNIGKRILEELLSRGHTVVAMLRNSSELQPTGYLAVHQDDLSDATKTAAIIKGADAVISAYAPPGDNTDQLLKATSVLISAVKQAGVPRLLTVGGAGSLEVAPGVTLLDSGHLPEEWKAIAISHSKALEILRDSGIDWTSLSPAAFIEPGTRTGKFRLGKDQLITDQKGESRISMEDYAIAMVDEFEHPAHIRERFTVGY